MPLTSDGQVIAGVGVSGGTTEQDVAIVEAAVINPNPPGPTEPSAARVPVGYTEQKARVVDVVINYARGGNGPTLVLLHGYPQTWYEWRELLPEFAKQYTVIAPICAVPGPVMPPPTDTTRRPWPPTSTGY